jgi:hypothetical protein
MAPGRSGKVIRYTLLAVAAAVFVAGCNSGPSQSAENTVGGANIVSSAKAPFQERATSLTLNWGSKAKPGQFAIADVLTYGGSKPKLTAPAGWQQISDVSTQTTRQSLYGHTVATSDPNTSTWTFSEPVDAQGAIVLLDNVASGWPVDMSSRNTGSSGAIVAKSVATTSDGDLILSFNATDFGAYRPHICTVCDGLNPNLPADVTVVINHESTAREYWILANYQTQPAETEPEESGTGQILNWVAAQVAIKRGVVGSATPSS